MSVFLIRIIMIVHLFVVSSVTAEVVTQDDMQKQIKAVSAQIDKNRKNAVLYVRRGDLYFQLHDFDLAIDDYTMAIKLDDKQDAAWFGRGMAKGRRGLISEGIADLTVFIKRNPENSKAYTKRGVRYLWKGDKVNAKKDLQKAIQLDQNNAEAHDDLGVVLAQSGDYRNAIMHFQNTISIDPTYQKGHHNLAMALYVIENDAQALVSVNNSLSLRPNSRNSMLLKSKILEALGRHTEAKRVADDAMFLPEANWSETAPVK